MTTHAMIHLCNCNFHGLGWNRVEYACELDCNWTCYYRGLGV